MKKDKKFLLDLENQLSSINKKDRDAIILKYRNIIDDELNQKKKIKYIIKDLGAPEEVAKKEITELRKNKKVNLDKLKNTLSKVGKNISNGSKKIYSGITKDIQLKPKEKKEKKNKEKEEKENYLENITSKNKKEVVEKKEEIKNKKSSVSKKENESKNKDLKIEKIKEKDNKKKKIKSEKDTTEDNKKNKEKKKIDLKSIFKFNKEKSKKEKKEFKFTNPFKKKKKNIVEEVIDEVEETFEDIVEEVSDAAEIISEKPIFMSKKERRKNIVLKTIGLIIVILMIIAWLWIDVIFVASLFAYLDGVKLYGINIGLFGLSLLVLWVIVMFNKLVFKKKNNFKVNLFITLTSVLILAVGIGLTINEISKIETVADVSQKYNMTTKYDTYNLPSKNEKMYISFNSNYDTQYIVKYDNKLEGKFKIEVKYFENYYDYYVKKSTNNIYVSLSRDTRDRISSYIDDLKENKIYKEDELSRYTVKITINEKDFERLVIEN